MRRPMSIDTLVSVWSRPIPSSHSVARARGGFFQRPGAISQSIAGLCGASQGRMPCDPVLSACLQNNVALAPAWRSTGARLATISTHQGRKSDGENRAVSQTGWTGSLAHRRGPFAAALYGRSHVEGAGHGIKSCGIHVHAWVLLG